MLKSIDTALDFFLKQNFSYFLPKLEMMKMTSAITAMTRKIPTPIPALKIPLITEQPVNDMHTKIKSIILDVLFFMIPCFKWDILHPGSDINF